MNGNRELFTLLTFTYPHESAIVIGLLEGRGIKTFMKDEHTVQMQPFYSNAIGGVKLQVSADDFTEAAEILLEAGYIPEGAAQQPGFFEKLEALTAGVPLLNRISPEARMLVIAAAIIIFIMLFIGIAAL